MRGSIAKDVNLDVQIFRPQQRLNLLETIINSNKNYKSSKLPVNPLELVRFSPLF